MDEPQHRAVDHESGPLLVLAGAGSGKTGTLAARVARPGRRRPLLRMCGDEAAEAGAVCDSVLAHRDDGSPSTTKPCCSGPRRTATGDPDGVEEERRLFYVAVTRARSVLEVSVPLRYHHRRRPLADAHGYAQPSRFLSAAVRGTMDADHVEDRPRHEDPAEQGGEVVAGGLAAVDRALAELWN